MGRLNLKPLRVRRQALANFKTQLSPYPAVWLPVTADVPPAQVFTRCQPTRHPLTKVRLKSIPSSSDQKPTLPRATSTDITAVEAPRSKKKPSRNFQPLPIRYEEDELRKQFYSHHPWELARPRVVLETTGDNFSLRDYSRNVRSPNMPLNGESVVQRQLYLLHHVPDITETEAYDIARKEFYAHRLREAIERRVSVEEAEAFGADFGKSHNQRSIEVEDEMYDNWEDWSRKQVADLLSKRAAFSGQQVESGPERSSPEKT
jgi:small subunit ribosomal protein S23